MKKVIPIVIMFALLFVVCSICEASIMSRLCSSFANVLDDEETKTAAAVKNCKKNCAIIQKKLDLIKAAQKKVDDSCAKGITPDITKVSAGLDKNVQAKLRKQYNQHSKMYDGKADLPNKDFGLTTKSNQSPGLTGLPTGAGALDLKAGDPSLSAKLDSGVAPLSAEAVPVMAAAGIPEPKPTVDCRATIESWKITNPAYAAACDCRNGPNKQPVCGTVKPPSAPAGSSFWNTLKIASKEVLKQITSALEFVKLVTDKILLAVGTSGISEKVSPTATMLLKHAKDAPDAPDGKNKVPLSNGNQSYLKEKVKNTSEYQDALKDVLAQLEKDPTLKSVKVTRSYKWYKNPDLYFAIHEFEVIGSRGSDGKIQIIFHDTYDFDAGDNPGMLGKLWQDNGLIKPYPIDIVMQ